MSAAAAPAATSEQLTKEEQDGLVLDHMGFARAVAWAYVRTHNLDSVTRQDIEGFAFEGLIDAARRFRPRPDVKFTSYAAWRIRGAIQDGLRKTGWFGGNPRNPKTRPDHWSPVSLEVAYIDANERRRHEANNSWYELLPGGPEPEGELGPGWDAEELWGALAEVPPRERFVLYRYYWDNRDLREIGQEMGVSESRVCQIIGKARRRLRSVLEGRLDGEEARVCGRLTASVRAPAGA